MSTRRDPLPPGDGPALHIKPDFGLPYARASFDGGSYHVVCPICGERCFAPEQIAAADRIIKSASLAYANHFTAAAEEGR